MQDSNESIVPHHVRLHRYYKSKLAFNGQTQRDVAHICKLPVSTVNLVLQGIRYNENIVRYIENLPEPCEPQ